MQNHTIQHKNRIAQLEKEVEEVSLYEKRDTFIISGSNLPKEEQNESTIDKTNKDSLHINIEHKDINEAPMIDSRNTQKSNRLSLELIEVWHNEWLCYS